MFNEKEFIEFLIEAKKSTYAGGGQEDKPSRPYSKDLPYEKGEYRYLDSYYGSINFIGQEIVWVADKALWGMNYYGEMLVTADVPEKFSYCLKEALKSVPYEAPYRGPHYYIYGDLEYKCQWHGDIASFSGEEFILAKGMKIYQLKFHGGYLRDISNSAPKKVEL